MDARYMVTRFNILRPHADRVLAGCDEEKAAREVMRGAQCGRDEGIELIDNHTGNVVATRGEKR